MADQKNPYLSDTFHAGSRRNRHLFGSCSSEGWCGTEWLKRDKLDTAGWALAFLWGGLVILAGTSGFSAEYGWWRGWSVFISGLGAIVILGTLVRQFVPGYRKNIASGYIFGFILLTLGLSKIMVFNFFWPVVLMGIGIILMVKVIWGK